MGWEYQSECGRNPNTEERSETCSRPELLQRALADALDRSTCDLLKKNGWVTVDGVFGCDTAKKLRDEIKYLWNSGHMFKNSTQFGGGSKTRHRNETSIVEESGAQATKQFVKPRIHEFDMHSSYKNAMREVPFFCDLFRGFQSAPLVSMLNRLIPTLDLQKGMQSTTLKLQYNEGSGGCFPLHYDNPGRPNKRKITCLVYLNEHWKEGDGGEIELIPFGEKPITISPKLDRLVMFFSDRILHRVLPAIQARYCFTIWIDGGSRVNSDDDVLLKQKHVAMRDASKDSVREVVDAFRKSPIQRSIARCVYREAYAESLLQCQGDGGPCMVESHSATVDTLMATPSVRNAVDAIRSFIEEST
eukprot:m.145920 g.145920  ORF g.145920 m.145920 type:complete len:360 (-) comp17749_c0_seq2:71-1150(-)